jgi:diguanylate cyclase (GGDEF)-like protein
MIGKILLLIVTTIILVTISHLNFDTFEHVRVYNFITESFIALVSALFFIKSHELKGKPYYYYISVGFFLTYIALVTDSLDQLYFHPELYTALTEKTFRLVGYASIFYGVSQWLKEYYQLNAKLKRQLDLDNLTGLYNRQGLLKQIGLIHDSAESSESSYTLAIIDFDDFKNVNDTFGHLAGDEVLLRVGDFLRNLMTDDIKIGRWGGEEFIIVMNHFTLEESIDRCDRLREQLLELELSDIIANHKVTVSIGVTQSQPEDSIHDVLNRADQALYQSKKQGKNNVNSL